MGGMGCQQCYDMPCTCEHKIYVATFTVRVEMTLTHPPDEECDELRVMLFKEMIREAPAVYGEPVVSVEYTIADEE
jgi:hypothetical protein